LTVTSCTFDNDSADIVGGGIYSDIVATLKVTSCTLDNDSAASSGGGIYNAATATSSTKATSRTLDNDSPISVGGPNFSGLTSTVTSCMLTGDSASLGGSIANQGTLTVNDCVLINDSATTQGGGIDNSGTLTVTGSTLANDSATNFGGGIFNLGTSTITNCTRADDSAALAGGGIFNFGASTLTNCTLDNDSASDGGGFHDQGGNATVNNTIVANNPLGGDFSFNGPAILKGSHNLIDDGSGGLADTITANPLLGSLENNGGSTETLALLPGSPAIDAGSNALALDPSTNPAITLTTDQRGVARAVNGTVDIGAFESRNFTIAITSGNGQSTTVNTRFLNPLVASVTSAYGDPVQGGVVTFTAPSGGASATFSASAATAPTLATAATTTAATTATIDPAGQAAIGVVANTVAGTYAVMANARGAEFAAGFSSTNLPGAAQQITLGTGASGQSTTVGEPFAAPLQLTVTDQFGNAVPGVSITYAAPSTGPGGMVSGGDVVTTDAHGVAAPTFVANTVAGSAYAVTATASGLRGSPVTFKLTNTPDVARSYIVSGFPSPATAGIAHTFTVTARDSYGNVATGYSGVVHFTATDPQAILPADAALSGGTGAFSATLKTAGTQSITASDTRVASLTNMQSAITVNPAAASKLRIAAPATVSPGVPFSFTVTALDAFANVAVGYTGTINFARGALLPAYAILTNGSGTFTATFASKGNRKLVATDIAAPGITGSVTIAVGATIKNQSVLAGSSSGSVKKVPLHSRPNPTRKEPIASSRGHRTTKGHGSKPVSVPHAGQ
jgi:hypothetical protein